MTKFKYRIFDDIYSKKTFTINNKTSKCVGFFILFTKFLKVRKCNRFRFYFHVSLQFTYNMCYEDVNPPTFLLRKITPRRNHIHQHNRSNTVCQAKVYPQVKQYLNKHIVVIILFLHLIIFLFYRNVFIIEQLNNLPANLP